MQQTELSLSSSKSAKCFTFHIGRLRILNFCCVGTISVRLSKEVVLLLRKIQSFAIPGNQ